MGKLVAVVAVCVAAIVWTTGCTEYSSSRTSDKEGKLESTVAYLKDIDEVSWVEVEGNDVYIGFKSRPSDLTAIVGAAALHGNRATGFGVHVWAVDAKHTGWRPGSGPYFLELTARHGKIED